MTKLLPIAIAAAVLAPASLFAQWNRTAEATPQQEAWIRLPSTGTSFPMDTLVGQSGPVTGRPLSADEVHRNVQTLSDGSHIESSETDHFYRDAMGRMRTETSSGTVIYDPVAGYTYDLTNWCKCYTRSTISPGRTVTIMARAHQSSVTSRSVSDGPAESKPGKGQIIEDLPAQYFNGVYAKGSRVTTTIPLGAIGNDRELKSVNERWYSDDLKLLLKTSNSDPRFGATTYELTNIVQSVPDPSLFQPPVDYKLVDHH